MLYGESVSIIEKSLAEKTIRKRSLSSADTTTINTFCNKIFKRAGESCCLRRQLSIPVRTRTATACRT